MPKKKTFEEVEATFNQRGYTLLSKDYQDSKTPLDYFCGRGHQTKIRFDDLQRGHGCAECGGKNKKTFEEVQAAFSQRNFQLVSKEYKNAFSPMEYICSNDHQSKISFNNLKSGQGCAECSVDSKRKTIEEVQQLFESRNFQLISDNYSNNKLMLNYICDKGHEGRIRFNDFNTGYGCPSCAEYGFNPNKSATLYYIRFQYEGNFYYKIGITNRTISERFQQEKTPYTVIKETGFTLGKEAYTQEQAILKKFSTSRYKGKPFLDCGNTELFIKDVLQIDYEPFQNFAA